jgi:hypothetical protein
MEFLKEDAAREKHGIDKSMLAKMEEYRGKYGVA